MVIAAAGNHNQDEAENGQHHEHTQNDEEFFHKDIRRLAACRRVIIIKFDVFWNRFRRRNQPGDEIFI